MKGVGMEGRTTMAAAWESDPSPVPTLEFGGDGR